MNELKRVTVKQLAYQIKGFGEIPTPRFAFFLGAGTSLQSGIPTASGMIRDFRRRIVEAECPDQCKTQEEIAEWLTSQPWYDDKNLYSALFEHYLPKEMARQQYIEALVKKAELSFGYVVLASLIAANYVKTIITTNFDDLIYSACTTYTGIRPVVYAHGLLAPELRFTSDNPKILKLHGDYLYSSLKNTKEELKTQDPNMRQQVIQTLNEYGLVVIGYSGSDESIREILSEISPKNDLFWCIHRNREPREEIARLLSEKRGVLVEIDGFDQFLDEVREVVGFNAGAMFGSLQKRQDDLIDQIMTYAPERKIGKVLNEIVSALDKQTLEHQAQVGKYRSIELFVQAVQAEEVDEFSDAENLYRKAIALNPNYANAYNNLGMLLFRKLNRPEEAEGAYRKAIELNPNYAIAYNNLGNLLSEKLNRPEEAEGAYRKAIELRPEYAAAYNNLGIALKKLNRVDEAEAAYRKAIELKPDYAIAHNNLGNLLVDKLAEEAEAAYRKAIDLEPEYAIPYNNLGMLFYRKLIRPEEAEAAYRKAIELKPDYADAYLNLGNVVGGKLNRAEEAEAAYHKAIELNSDNPIAYNNLGIVLNKLNRAEEAKAMYRKAIELKSDYADPYNNLGNLLADKLPEEAEAAYRRAIELKPDYATAHNNLGTLLDKLDRPGEAEAAFRKAIDLKPDYANAYYNFGCLLGDKLNRPEEAEAAFRKAIELKAEDIETLNKLGWLLLEKNCLEESKSLFGRCIVSDASYYPSFFNLGLVYALLGDTEEGRNHWQKALGLYNRDSSPEINHVILLVATGESAKGFEELQVILDGSGITPSEKGYALRIANQMARIQPKIIETDQLIKMLSK